MDPNATLVRLLEAYADASAWYEKALNTFLIGKAATDSKLQWPVQFSSDGLDYVIEQPASLGQQGICTSVRQFFQLHVTQAAVHTSLQARLYQSEAQLAEQHSVGAELMQSIHTVHGSELLGHAGQASIPQLVRTMGAAVLRSPEPVVQQIRPQLVKAVAHIGTALGQPIFDQVVYDAAGQVQYNERGLPDMSAGTEQRCQVKLDGLEALLQQAGGKGTAWQRGKQQGEASKIQAAYLKLPAAERKLIDQELQLMVSFNAQLEAALREALQLTGPSKLRSPAILVSKPGPEPCGMQALHCDAASGREDYMAVITALQRDTSVVVQLFSHHAILALNMFDRHTEDPDAEDEGQPFVDGLFQRIMPRLRLVRVVLQPGESLVLHGNTVHAGDRGQPGTCLPRLHHYVQDESVADATNVIECTYEDHPNAAANILWQVPHL